MIKKYGSISIIIFIIFLLSACSQKTTDDSSACPNYNYFIQKVSPDFYQSLASNGYTITKDNYNDMVSSVQYLEIKVEEIDSEYKFDGIECMTSLSSLSLNGLGINDLKPLLYTPQLESLNLNNTRVSNLNALKNLIHLKTLVINDTKTLTNLEGLDKLTALTNLNLANDALLSIDQLEGLPNLTFLNVDGNDINFEGVISYKGFSSLERLILTSNQVCSTTALGSISSLRYLDLSNNTMKDCSKNEYDFSFLSHLNNLEVLKLNAMGLNTLNFIESKNLPKLKQLEVSNNEISSIKPLTENKKLVSLESIQFDSNQIDDISTLASIPQLKSISFQTNFLQNVEILVGLEQLKDVNLSNNQIKQLPVMENHLNQLKTLNLSHNEVTTIESLQGLEQVSTIDLQDNKITEIHSSFNTMPRLKNVLLNEGNKISVIEESFNDLPQLELPSPDELEFNFNTENLIVRHSFNRINQIKQVFVQDKNIKDIDDFSFNLPNVVTFDVSSNELTQINWVSNMPILVSFNASNNQLSNIEGLRDLTNEDKVIDTKIRTLQLANNLIQDTSPLENLVTLNELDLSNNKIDSMNFIHDLNLLTSLNLEHNTIKQIQEIDNKKNLNELNLAYNEIEEISGLNDFTKLGKLTLHHNQIKRISGLNNVKLNSLDLSNMMIQEITNNSFMGATISDLNLSNNKLQDIHFINNFKRLESVDVSSNQISAVDYLESTPYIKEFNLDQNPMEIFTGFNNFEGLQQLVLPTSITQFINALNYTNEIIKINNGNPNDILKHFTIQTIDNSLNSFPFNFIIFPESFGQNVEISYSFYYVKSIDFAHTTFENIQFIMEMKQLEWINLRGNDSIHELKDLSCKDLNLNGIDLTGSNVSLISNSFNDCPYLSDLILDSKSDLTIINSFNNQIISNITVSEGLTLIVENSFNRNDEITSKGGGE